MSTNESHAALDAAKAKRQEARARMKKAEASLATNSKTTLEAKAALDELQAAYEAAENEQAVSGAIAGGKYPELERLARDVSAARIHHGIAVKAQSLSVTAHEQAQTDARAALAAIYAEADRLVKIEQSEKLAEFQRVVTEQLAPLAAWLPVQDDVHTPRRERIQGLSGRVLAAFHQSGGIDVSIAPGRQYGVGKYLSPLAARRAELIGDPNAVVRDDQADLIVEVERGKELVQQGIRERAKNPPAESSPHVTRVA